MAENELVDFLNTPKKYVQKYLDAVPDPKTLFQKKQEAAPPKPFKYDGPKEKEEQRKASEASRRKVGGSDGKVSTAQKQAASKKTPQRKRVAGK